MSHFLRRSLWSKFAFHEFFPCTLQESSFFSKKEKPNRQGGGSERNLVKDDTFYDFFHTLPVWVLKTLVFPQNSTSSLASSASSSASSAERRWPDVDALGDVGGSEQQAGTQDPRRCGSIRAILSFGQTRHQDSGEHLRPKLECIRDLSRSDWTYRLAGAHHCMQAFDVHYGRG